MLHEVQVEQLLVDVPFGDAEVLLCDVAGGLLLSLRRNRARFSGHLPPTSALLLCARIDGLKAV